LEPNSGEGRTTRLIFHPADATGSPAAGFLLDDSIAAVSFFCARRSYSARATQRSQSGRLSPTFRRYHARTFRPENGEDCLNHRSSIILLKK